MKKTYPFNMRIDKETRDSLTELAEDTHMSMSELIRLMIKVTHRKHMRVKAQNASGE